MPRKNNSFIAYHGTNAIFSNFDIKRTVQGIIWFSTDLDKIARGDSGAAGRSRILKVKVTIKNPAGWNEYDKLTLGQIRQHYDGVILKEKGEEHFDGFVFSSSQIKILGIV